MILFGPQELVLNMNNFNQKKFLDLFNFFANIRIKVSDTEFEVIDYKKDCLELDNLICFSPMASVVLIFEDSIDNYNLQDLTEFIKYINKFSIPIVYQINTDNEITYDEITKLKILGNIIQIKTGDNLNAETLTRNVRLLTDSEIKTSVKLLINKNSADEVKRIPDMFSKDIAAKLYFTLPYVTTKYYKDIQNKFVKNGYTNIKLATCGFKRFNKNADKLNTILIPTECDALKFSIYIEDGIVYPCEFTKINGIKFTKKLNSIHDIWYYNKFNKFRSYVVENNFCKSISK